MASLRNPCPCCSEKEYEDCCRNFHQGALPGSALQLMRSRYAAYALNLADYIIKTTHPNNPHYSDDKAKWKEEIEKFSKTTKFLKLEILDYNEQNHLSTVTFKAHLIQNARDVSFTERSAFEKVGGCWLYLNGIID